MFLLCRSLCLLPIYRYMICIVIFDPRDCWLNRVNSHSDWSNPLKVCPNDIEIVVCPSNFPGDVSLFLLRRPKCLMLEIQFFVAQEKHCCRSCLCGVSLLTTCEEQTVCGSKCGFGHVLTNGRWNIGSKKLVSASLCCRQSLRTERAGWEEGGPGMAIGWYWLILLNDWWLMQASDKVIPVLVNDG